MRKWLLAVAGCALLLGGCALLFTGCTHTVKVEPIQVQPIHITMDIYLRVERQLDDFFGFQKEMDQKAAPPKEPAPGETKQGEGKGGESR